MRVVENGKGGPESVRPRPAADLVGYLRLQTAPEQIADRILAAIAVGILNPGDRLPPERQLTNTFGVSRTTLRQAISRLSALGVVQVKRGRQGGTFVAGEHQKEEELAAIQRALGPIRDQLEAMLDYRNLIQQVIAKAAARRRDESDLVRMRAALAAYRDSKTATQSRDADRELHQAIAQAARNVYLVHLNDELGASANLGFAVHPYSRELHLRALEQHSALVDAIELGDAVAAEALAAEHFEVTGTKPWTDAFAAVEVGRTQG
ncbi:MAG: GntR family transcriptional regulator [Actinomycetota bacterium]|nr:GntR family transcriptional regulator [Actinomycetota bacterium]